MRLLKIYRELPLQPEPAIPIRIQTNLCTGVLFRFKIKDDIKAARNEATTAYKQYDEKPKTSLS